MRSEDCLNDPTTEVFLKVWCAQESPGCIGVFFLIECVGVILVNRIIEVSGIQAYSEIADSDSVILGVELRVCIPNQLPVDATTDAGPWLSF